MGIAGQKLMSFLLATTTLSDIVHAVTATFADLLLSGESEGFAIDATGVTASPAYVGAPEAGYVSIIEVDSPAALMSNLPLDDPRSPLVQSGTSPKLVRYHSDNGDSPGSDYPLMRWTPHNLITQSQTMNTWNLNNSSVTADNTTSPDGTATADRVNSNSGSSGHSVYAADVTTLANVPYTYSCYFKQGTAQYFMLHLNVSGGATTDWIVAVFDLTNGTVTQASAGATATYISSSITSVGSGWYRATVTGTLPGTLITPDLAFGDTGTPTLGNYGSYTFNAAGTETVFVWGAQLVRGYNANPYLVTTSAARIGIPVEYDTAASKYGILVEPAATNLVLRSEEFGTTWSTAANTTLSTNNTTAPDGSSTADKLTGTASANDVAGTSQSASATASTTYTLSAFLKNSGTNQYVRLYVGDFSGNDVRVWFDITNGTVGSHTTNGSGWTYVSSSIVAVGNGWYRVAAAVTVAGSANLFFTGTSADAGDAGTTNSSYWIWGAQFELGSVATSYIPTLGSTVTRAADLPNALTSTYPHSDSAGTFVVSFKSRIADHSALDRIIDLSDDTTNELVLMALNTGDTPDSVGMQVTDAGSIVVVASVTKAGSISTSSGNKAAIAYQLNNSGIVVDGSAEVTDTGCTMPTVTRLRLATSGAAAREINGYLYQITYVPRRMTEAQMQAKTT